MNRAGYTDLDRYTVFLLTEASESFEQGEIASIDVERLENIATVEASWLQNYNVRSLNNVINNLRVNLQSIADDTSLTDAERAQARETLQNLEAEYETARDLLNTADIEGFIEQAQLRAEAPVIPEALPAAQTLEEIVTDVTDVGHVGTLEDFDMLVRSGYVNPTVEKGKFKTIIDGREREFTVPLSVVSQAQARVEQEIEDTPLEVLVGRITEGVAYEQLGTAEQNQVLLVTANKNYREQGEPLATFVQQLGEGGFGAYVSVSDSLGLKVLHEDAPESHVEALQNEGEILTLLGEHEHIVGYRGRGKGPHHLALERGQAGFDTSADDLGIENGFNGENPKTPEEMETDWGTAWEALRAMTQAGLRMSEHDVVHRDIKPDNLIAGQDGNIKLIDYGLASRVKDITDDTSGSGTSGYIAPEVLRKEALESQSTDIFSIMMTFLELGCGASNTAGGLDSRQIEIGMYRDRYVQVKVLEETGLIFKKQRAVTVTIDKKNPREGLERLIRNQQIKLTTKNGQAIDEEKFKDAVIDLLVRTFEKRNTPQSLKFNSHTALMNELAFMEESFGLEAQDGFDISIKVPTAVPTGLLQSPEQDQRASLEEIVAAEREVEEEALIIKQREMSQVLDPFVRDKTAQATVTAIIEGETRTFNVNNVDVSSALGLFTGEDINTGELHQIPLEDITDVQEFGAEEITVNEKIEQEHPVGKLIAFRSDTDKVRTGIFKGIQDGKIIYQEYNEQTESYVLKQYDIARIVSFNVIQKDVQTYFNQAKQMSKDLGVPLQTKEKNTLVIAIQQIITKNSPEEREVIKRQLIEKLGEQHETMINMLIVALSDVEICTSCPEDVKIAFEKVKEILTEDQEQVIKQNLEALTPSMRTLLAKTSLDNGVEESDLGDIATALRYLLKETTDEQQSEELKALLTPLMVGQVKQQLESFKEVTDNSVLRAVVERISQMDNLYDMISALNELSRVLLGQDKNDFLNLGDITDKNLLKTQAVVRINEIIQDLEQHREEIEEVSVAEFLDVIESDVILGQRAYTAKNIDAQALKNVAKEGKLRIDPESSAFMLYEVDGVEIKVSVEALSDRDIRVLWLASYYQKLGLTEGQIQSELQTISVIPQAVLHQSLSEPEDAEFREEHPEIVLGLPDYYKRDQQLTAGQLFAQGVTTFADLSFYGGVQPLTPIGGGDFMVPIETDAGHAYVMIDLPGHGLKAAMLREVMMTFIDETGPVSTPEEFVNRLEQFMIANGIGMPIMMGAFDADAFLASMSRHSLFENALLQSSLNLFNSLEAFGSHALPSVSDAELDTYKTEALEAFIMEQFNIPKNEVNAFVRQNVVPVLQAVNRYRNAMPSILQLSKAKRTGESIDLGAEMQTTTTMLSRLSKQYCRSFPEQSGLPYDSSLYGASTFGEISTFSVDTDGAVHTFGIKKIMYSTPEGMQLEEVDQRQGPIGTRKLGGIDQGVLTRMKTARQDFDSRCAVMFSDALYEALMEAVDDDSVDPLGFVTLQEIIQKQLDHPDFDAMSAQDVHDNILAEINQFLSERNVAMPDDATLLVVKEARAEEIRQGEIQRATARVTPGLVTRKDPAFAEEVTRVLGSVLERLYNNYDPNTIQFINAGAFGSVFRITNRETGITVAIKIANSDEIVRGVTKFYVSLQEEIENYHKIGDGSHPNLVSMVESLDYREGLPGEEQAPCLVLEEYEGSLSDFTFQYRSLNRDQELRDYYIDLGGIFYATEAGKGVQYVHQQGYVVNDVKPMNILHRSGGLEIAVADIGLLKPISRRPSERIVGTEVYMAKEKGVEGYQNKQTDLHELSVSLDEMLVGYGLYFVIERDPVTDDIIGTNYYFRDQKVEHAAQYREILSELPLQYVLDSTGTSLPVQQGENFKKDLIAILVDSKFRKNQMGGRIRSLFNRFTGSYDPVGAFVKRLQKLELDYGCPCSYDVVSKLRADVKSGYLHRIELARKQLESIVKMERGELKQDAQSVLDKIGTVNENNDMEGCTSLCSFSIMMEELENVNALIAQGRIEEAQAILDTMTTFVGELFKIRTEMDDEDKANLETVRALMTPAQQELRRISQERSLSQLEQSVLDTLNEMEKNIKKIIRYEEVLDELDEEFGELDIDELEYDAPGLGLEIGLRAFPEDLESVDELPDDLQSAVNEIMYAPQVGGYAFRGDQVDIIEDLARHYDVEQVEISSGDELVFNINIEGNVYEFRFERGTDPDRILEIMGQNNRRRQGLPVQDIPSEGIDISGPFEGRLAGSVFVGDIPSPLASAAARPNLVDFTQQREEDLEALVDRLDGNRELHPDFLAFAKGGQAKVYALHYGMDIPQSRKRVVKYVRIDDPLVNPQGLIDKLGLEAAILREVSDHPNIVTYYDSVSGKRNAEGEIEYRYIVLEQVGTPSSGITDLKQYAEALQETKHTPIPTALAITKQIASALQYCRSKNIVHRDLKPANVLIQGSEAKLTDFGLAVDISDVERIEDERERRAIQGTLPYISSERMKDFVREEGSPYEHSPNPQDDLYSLGHMLAQLAGVPIDYKHFTTDARANLEYHFSIGDVPVFDENLLEELEKHIDAKTIPGYRLTNGKYVKQSMFNRKKFLKIKDHLIKILLRLLDSRPEDDAGRVFNGEAYTRYETPEELLQDIQALEVLTGELEVDIETDTGIEVSISQAVSAETDGDITRGAIALAAPIDPFTAEEAISESVAEETDMGLLKLFTLLRNLDCSSGSLICMMEVDYSDMTPEEMKEIFVNTLKTMAQNQGLTMIDTFPRLVLQEDGVYTYDAEENLVRTELTPEIITAVWEIFQTELTQEEQLALAPLFREIKKFTDLTNREFYHAQSIHHLLEVYDSASAEEQRSIAEDISEHMLELMRVSSRNTHMVLGYGEEDYGQEIQQRVFAIMQEVQISRKSIEEKIRERNRAARPAPAVARPLATENPEVYNIEIDIAEQWAQRISYEEIKIIHAMLTGNPRHLEEGGHRVEPEHLLELMRMGSQEYRDRRESIAGALPTRIGETITIEITDELTQDDLKNYPGLSQRGAFIVAYDKLEYFRSLLRGTPSEQGFQLRQLIAQEKSPAVRSALYRFINSYNAIVVDESQEKAADAFKTKESEVGTPECTAFLSLPQKVVRAYFNNYRGTISRSRGQYQIEITRKNYQDYPAEIELSALHKRLQELRLKLRQMKNEVDDRTAPITKERKPFVPTKTPLNVPSSLIQMGAEWPTMVGQIDHLSERIEEVCRLGQTAFPRHRRNIIPVNI